MVYLCFFLGKNRAEITVKSSLKGKRMVIEHHKPQDIENEHGSMNIFFKPLINLSKNIPH